MALLEDLAALAGAECHPPRVIQFLGLHFNPRLDADQHLPRAATLTSRGFLAPVYGLVLLGLVRCGPDRFEPLALKPRLLLHEQWQSHFCLRWLTRSKQVLIR